MTEWRESAAAALAEQRLAIEEWLERTADLVELAEWNGAHGLAAELRPLAAAVRSHSNDLGDAIAELRPPARLELEATLRRAGS